MRKRNMTLCILITINACGRRRITCVVIPHRHIALLAWRHWYIRIRRPVRCMQCTQCERFRFGMKRSKNYMAKIIRSNSYANVALLMLTHIPSPVLSVPFVLHVSVAVIVYLNFFFFVFSNFGFIFSCTRCTHFSDASTGDWWWLFLVPTLSSLERNEN